MHKFYLRKAQTVNAAAPSKKGVYGSSEIPPLERALGALKDLGFANLNESDLTRLTPVDPFEEELVVMADVRAYFQVAYKVNTISIVKLQPLLGLSTC